MTRAMSDHIAEAVKRIRAERRIPMTTLETWLRVIGQPIPRQGLHRLERGERRVEVDELVALAQVLGVSPLVLAPLISESGSVTTQPQVGEGDDHRRCIRFGADVDAALLAPLLGLGRTT